MQLLREFMYKIILIIFLITPFSIQALEEDPVKEKYKSRLNASRKKYLDSVEKVRLLMIIEYKKYLKAALRRKDLETANMIKGKIDFLQNKDAAIEKEKPEKTNGGLEFGIPQKPK